MILNEGYILSIILTILITGLIKKLKSVIKNDKIKKLIPSGYFISLVVGLVIIFTYKQFFISNTKETLWSFLESWIIVSGLSGFSYISYKKFLDIVEVFKKKER